jgi:hypothetical protein
MLAIKTKEEIIASAVLWWVEQLAGPPKGLNDDRESFGSLLAILLSATHGSEDITAESQHRFAKELKQYLEEQSEARSRIILDFLRYVKKLESRALDFL